MLKKFISLLIVLCLLLSLAACGGNPPATDNDNAATTTTTTAASTQEPLTPALNPTFAAMPEKKQTMAQVYRVGDSVVLGVFIVPGMDVSAAELVSYDLASDTLLGELDLGETNKSILPLEDSFAVLEYATKTYTVYNTACEVQSSVTLAFDGEIGSAAQNGDKLLLSDMRTGRNAIYHLPTHTSTSVDETLNVAMTNCVGNHKDGFVVQSYEHGLLIVEPDGTVQTVRKVSDGIQMAGTTYAGGVVGDYTLFHSLAGGESVMIPSRGVAETFCSADGNRLLSISDGADDGTGGRLHYYDLQRRTVTDYVVDGYAVDAVLFGSYAVLAVHEDFASPITLAFVDLAALPAVSMDAAAYDADAVAGRKPLPAVSGVAAEIKETYGVTVIGDVDFFDLSVFGYTATPASADRIAELLDDVKDVLAFFPAGIFKEIGEKTPVVIVLCEWLGNGADGINTVLDGYNVSYVCVTGNDDYVESTAAHEMAHAVERQIATALLDGWVSMQPAEVQAAYGNLYLTVEFTADDKGRTPVWFVNGAYGRSEPIEDRATLFAKMYDCYVEGNSAALNYDGLKQKVAYWGRMLRETYDCCADGTFAWDTLFS